MPMICKQLRFFGKIIFDFVGMYYKETLNFTIDSLSFLLRLKSFSLYHLLNSLPILAMFLMVTEDSEGSNGFASSALNVGAKF
ncbi:hypothetical protein Q648_00978 [Bartonella quintana JK 12]|uniref:Uncharacterized protein n=2 Tax=Bartonella quintana TaxID=803 RepID=W3U0P8_BARQI|nr:hypothetical protein Q651_00789 [Bartonella quintana BQ2-D70]ETS14733.1 hypothetical protein Q650_00120 [Bartonella quintana JK 73rel]ETS17166.1 hypothetical protein Q649_00121 [Bartonella quintana JK 73]ETS17261.1 hypothetical protein Q648_00978 [Bartonella quintana JK 12]ETS19459.1 hypothetical protein Q647_00120 [Bartonella quintana JK 7]KEC58244.1 hypothetical protein O93_01117 [Bartonella quintana JK 19]KEC62149.1 hypothetical protein O91_00767 [Bartonella quintana JK 31]KEC63893.1 h